MKITGIYFSDIIHLMHDYFSFFCVIILLCVCDFSPDLVSAAADALLPLILCEQGLYQVFLQFFIIILLIGTELKLDELCWPSST